jgi:hypothetical protein
MKEEKVPSIPMHMENNNIVYSSDIPRDWERPDRIKG